MSNELQSCTHPALGELIHGYELGTLSESDALRFEDHLVECSVCRAQLDSVEPLMQALAAERDAVLAELRRTGDSFSAQLNRAKSARSTSWLSRFLHSAYTRYALAPVLAVGIIATVFVLRKPPPARLSMSIEMASPSDHATLKLPTQPAPDTTRGGTVLPGEPAEITAPPTASTSVAPHRERPELTALGAAPAAKSITAESQTDESRATPLATKMDASDAARTGNETAKQELESGAEARIMSVEEQTSAVAGAPNALDLRVDLSRARTQSESAAPMLKVGSDQPYQSIDNSGVPLPRFRAAGTDQNQAALQRGGAQYGSRDFPGAMSSLEQARKALPQSAEPPFYWAVCRYLTVSGAANRDEALRAADNALQEAERQLAAADTLHNWIDWYRAQIAADRGEDANALLLLSKLGAAAPPLHDAAQRLREQLLVKTLPAKAK